LTSYVVDASVAAKWLVPAGSEPLIPQAHRLLNDYLSGTISVVVPDLFWAELGNMLWKAVRRGRLTRVAADLGFASMKEHRLATVPSLPFLDAALGMAMAHDRAVYDCIYLALAAQSKQELITADERLVNAMAAHAPVKWLGTV